MNALIKLICPVSRVTYDMMTGIMVVTAGKYLMETTLEFVARIFVMTSRRSANLLHFFPQFMDSYGPVELALI